LLLRLRRVLLGLALIGLVLSGAVMPAVAAPGLCVGPVCGDQFVRSSTYPWQLRLRVSDQQGRRERLLIDCRTGVVSPLLGSVERGYATAVARRACRLDEAVLRQSAA
jgi:hypothetical protein